MRCFIGVPVDTALALTLVDARDHLVKMMPGAGPAAVPAANFHMTLAFLGDVDPAVFDPIYALLHAVAGRFDVFAQPLTSVHQFPHKAARILAAEGPPVDDLLVMRQQLFAGLSALPLTLKKASALRPHVTLARMQRAVVPPPSQVIDAALRVDSLVLYASKVQQTRRRYRMLRRAELNRA